MVNTSSTGEPGGAASADTNPWARIDTWVFDLDNTLYPETSTLFDQINDKMNLYMATLLDMEVCDASRMRQGFYEVHGTTLNGLMREYNADPGPFLDFVHDIDLSRISPAPGLKLQLGDLPGRCLVHTNGTTAHAERVLARLGIEKCFDGIFDIVASDFRPKPQTHAFSRFIDAFGVDPGTAVMFEDKAENLEVPHDLGMTTVWINHRAGDEELPEHAHVHHLSQDIGAFLGKVIREIGYQAADVP